jgi:hypothetical protein
MASDLLKCGYRAAPAVVRPRGPDDTPGGVAMAERTCMLPDCEDPYDSHGYCGRHAYRWRTHGDPLAGGSDRRKCSCGAGPRHALLFHRHFEASERDANGCLIWAGPKNKQTGYGTLGKQTAHRLAYAIFVGPIPPGVDVCHRCDNPPCVDYERCLFLGTQADNMADCAAKGRNHHPRGELSPNAKMTEELVRQLRQRHAAGERVNDLARAFGIDSSNASRIVSRQTWNHVP